MESGKTNLPYLRKCRVELQKIFSATETMS